MIVPSPQFLIFALIGAILFNIGKTTLWRQIVLLTVNILFLLSFSYNPVALAPFAGFLALGYAAYLATRGGQRAHLFAAVIVLTLFAFFWLKRYTFIPSSLYLPFPYLLVGLSYVFFRVLHLIIDGHQNESGEPVGWLSYLNYTLNFTCLVSGPIQRYEDYRKSEIAPPDLTVIFAGRGIERIVIGYFKVAIVSMFLSQFQHRSIEALAGDATLASRVWDGALIMAIYPIYLYFNFSGYVDVVIGVARFFRMELPENFDRPFSSENVIIFWNRWHITLSSWLKTYVYNPLMIAGMERITSPSLSAYIAVFAFFVTFFLVGLWHGQTSEFMFFGLLTGGGVSANKLYQLLMAKRLGRAGFRKLCATPSYIAICRGLNFTWFAFTLLWFWSNWAQIRSFIENLGLAACMLAVILTVLTATIILSILETLRTSMLRITWSIDPGLTEPVFASRYVRTAYSTMLVVITVTIIVLLASPAPDIVYKAF